MARATFTEDLTAQVDGVTSSFAVAGGPFISGTLSVSLGGQQLRPGFDFTENVGFTGFDLDFLAQVGDTLLVQFEIDDVGAGFPLVCASGREENC